MFSVRPQQLTSSVRCHCGLSPLEDALPPVCWLVCVSIVRESLQKLITDEGGNELSEVRNWTEHHAGVHNSGDKLLKSIK